MSDDPFSRFGLPARPLLSPGLVKERYHAISRYSFDGANPQADPAQLNRDYAVLLDEVKRVRALLVLHGIDDPDQSARLPESVLGLFSKVGEALRQAQLLIERIDKADSAVARALLQAEVMETTLTLQSIAGEVGSRRRDLAEGLAQLDKIWAGEGSSPQSAVSDENIASLHHVYSEMVYIERWKRQLDDALFRLMSF